MRDPIFRYICCIKCGFENIVMTRIDHCTNCGAPIHEDAIEFDKQQELKQEQRRKDAYTSLKNDLDNELNDQFKSTH